MVGERRRQTQPSKLGSFKISVKERIPGGWDPQRTWTPTSGKAVTFTRYLPHPAQATEAQLRSKILRSPQSHRLVRTRAQNDPVLSPAPLMSGSKTRTHPRTAGPTTAARAMWLGL